MKTPMTPAPLARALLAVLFAWPLAAAAQQDAAAAKKELETAREDLQRAAKRVAELSRASGAHGTPLEIDRLIVRKPRLGVLLAGDDGAGVRITGVTPDSGAARAGLKAGDRLLRIAGKPVAGDSGEQRLEHARTAVADLQADTPVALTFQRDGRERDVRVTPTLVSPRIAFASSDGPGSFTIIRSEGTPWVEGVPLPVDELRNAISPEVRRELGRLGTLKGCEGGDCKLPALADAFRWSGLNLASVDAQLGRYFGTGKGVLVLSADTLEGLQAGDVILALEGRPVATPREVMDALRGKPEDATVPVEYLRDRQPRTATLAVPKATPLRLPMPAQIALQARPAGKPGDAVQVVEQRRVMLIDADGNVRTFGDDTDGMPPLPAPPSPPAPPAPPAGKGGAVL